MAEVVILIAMAAQQEVVVMTKQEETNHWEEQNLVTRLKIHLMTHLKKHLMIHLKEQVAQIVMEEHNREQQAMENAPELYKEYLAWRMGIASKKRTEEGKREWTWLKEEYSRVCNCGMD